MPTRVRSSISIQEFLYQIMKKKPNTAKSFKKLMDSYSLAEYKDALGVNVCLFVLWFNVPINIYGHVETVS